MLLGGEAFTTRRHVFWNFVSSSRDRINQAKEDWKARRFPLVPGDDQEFIPLPESADHGQLSVTEFRRVALNTGVTLNVALAGRPPESPPVILLHGFPESHRTWRGVAPLLEDDFHLIMPDQRGFAGSDRPQDVAAYTTDALVDDIFALADALGLERFALVGHDWGGAIAWPAALRGDPRLTRLAIVNAPHPVIFQKSLIESADQRAASQYINAFRTPGFEKSSRRGPRLRFSTRPSPAMSTSPTIPEAEKRQYLADWAQPGALPRCSTGIAHRS